MAHERKKNTALLGYNILSNHLTTFPCNRLRLLHRSFFPVTHPSPQSRITLLSASLLYFLLFIIEIIFTCVEYP